MRSSLIIEDCNFHQELFKSTLEKFDFDICIAANGQDGLTQYRQSKPDLIVLDIHMPWMNGISFMQELLKNDPQTLPKIIVCSGQVLSDTHLETIDQLGCFLEKPVELSKFETILHKFGFVLHKSPLDPNHE